MKNNQSTCHHQFLFNSKDHRLYCWYLFPIFDVLYSVNPYHYIEQGVSRASKTNRTVIIKQATAAVPKNSIQLLLKIRKPPLNFRKKVPTTPTSSSSIFMGCAREAETDASAALPPRLSCHGPMLLESPELLQLACGNGGPNADRDNSLALWASCRTARRCSRSGPRSAWASPGTGRSRPRVGGAASGAITPPGLGSASSHCISPAGFSRRRRIGVGGAGELIVEGRGGKGEQRRRGKAAH
jgi:hypothetical protein